MPYKVIISVLISIAMVIYPFLVYYGLSEYGPATFAVALFVLLICRVVVKGNFHEPSQWLQLIVVSAFCLAVVVVNSEGLLRLYPVLMNVGFALLFAFSLKSDTCLIERFTRMGKIDYPEEAVGYMRNLTAAWAVLLFINAGISAYTACCMSLKVWTVYNGLIAYFILGGFSIIEIILRPYFKKRLANSKKI